MSENTIIISQPWGGLGDNLQFSTLPELYSKLGYTVYISKNNAYRNSELYDVVWGLNPYVSGISDARPNAGACVGLNHHTGYFLTDIELSHQLTNGYRLYPVIYYKPKFINDLSNCLLYDTTSISTTPNETSVAVSFNSIINKFPYLTHKKVVFKNIKNRNITGLIHDEYIVETLYDMCDAINSCNIFLTLFSGSCVLASAIKQDNKTPEIYTFNPKEYTDNTGYKFKNINHLELL